LPIADRWRALSLLFAAAAIAPPAPALADPLVCNTINYKPAAGLTATVADNALTVAWTGDRGQELRTRSEERLCEYRCQPLTSSRMSNGRFR